MKVTDTVDAPVAFFYQRIIDSVLYDINHETGQTLTPAMLQGYEYRKSMGPRGSIRIKITKIVQNQTYTFDSFAGPDTYHTRYELRPTEDGRTEVSYQEDVDYAETMKKRNSQLMMILIGWSKKRRMKKMWAQIAASQDQI